MPKRLLIYSNDSTDHVSAKRREGGATKSKTKTILCYLYWDNIQFSQESMRGAFPTNWIPQIYSMGISM